MKISYDYSDLIKELEEELDEGILNFNSKIKIVRKFDSRLDDYRPIIDWYYFDNNATEEVEIVVVEDVLAEMQEWNRLI